MFFLVRIVKTPSLYIHTVFSIDTHTIFFEWIGALSKKYTEFYVVGKIVYTVSPAAEKLLQSCWMDQE